MIYTLTPNPALDLGGLVKEVVPNEKSYVFNETRYPGGNAINVSRIITRLNVPNIALGFLGGGVGKEIELLLKEENVPCRFTKIAGSSRVNVTVSLKDNHEQTRLSFPGPKISAKEVKDLMIRVQQIKGSSGLIIGGSLPPGFSVQHVRKLIHICHKKRIPCWVDIPAEDLRKVITAGPSFIKPNLVEFQGLIGKKVSTLKQVLNEIDKLHKHISLICVSSVEGGAVLSTKECTWFGSIPKVKVRSSVGAGDSMIAAMLAKSDHGRTEGLRPEDVGDLLRWGLASSTATLVQTGTELGHPRDIKKFYQKTKVERVR